MSVIVSFRLYISLLFATKALLTVNGRFYGRLSDWRERSLAARGHILIDLAFQSRGLHTDSVGLSFPYVLRFRLHADGQHATSFLSSGDSRNE